MKMNFSKSTSWLLAGFTFPLIFVITFFFLIVEPALATQKKADSVSSVSASAADNRQSIGEQCAAIAESGPFVYGKSGLGENLTCYKIAPVTPAKTKILITFEVHGYEDDYDKDGQVLVNIGNSIKDYFSSNRQLLGNCELYIVPSANPDGLAHGVSKDGVGRCQVSLGVNINRDFDYYFQTNSDSRNRTLDKPFSAPESRALRDLVGTLKPDAVIDFHGWENKFIGDSGLTDCFKDALNIGLHKDFSVNVAGFFSAWASTQGARAMLLEYPSAAHDIPNTYTGETIAGIQNMISKYGQGLL